jgi:hypothetical protein
VILLGRGLRQSDRTPCSGLVLSKAERRVVTVSDVLTDRAAVFRLARRLGVELNSYVVGLCGSCNAGFGDEVGVDGEAKAGGCRLPSAVSSAATCRSV